MEEPVVEALQGYLLKLLPIVLECQERDIKHFKLLDKETILIPFATDPSSRLLFFSKTIQGEAEAEGVLEEPQISFIASNSVVFHPNYESSAILIKLVAHLEEAIPMAQQCILMNIPKGSPYEIIHAYIHNAAYPLFDAYVDTIDKNNTTNSSSLIKKQGDGKMGIPVTRKKFAELELSLMNLQQNVEIPQVILVHHQDVLDAIEKGRRDNAASKPSVEDFAEKASDSSFLNRLQAGVNSWIKEIQKVTKLNRDPSSISASQEINFWISMEKSLSAIETQLKSEEVVLTLEILKSAKRFHTTVSFIADTGLKESLDQVSKYNILMKEFPLNDLLSAPEMEKVKESLLAIFNHLNKKMKLSPYPVKRALVFVEAISNDFLNQLIKVLGTRRLMSLEYEEFEKINQSCQEAFLIWEDQIKEFTAVCRDVTRKRGEKIILLKINNAHEKLVERLSFISKFRNQHEQLLHTIINVTKQRANGGFRNASGFTDSSAVEEIKAAYEVVKSVDVLDVSTAGTEEWIQVESTYNDRISKVEGQIISVLRNNLATCKNANEMFRVFSTFNSLFVRPKIRGAVQEYQTELMENVKKDIFVLQEKFKKQYRNSEAFVLNQMRDIPPVAGAIMWAKQIENQLNTYMRRVEDVLGKGWELYSEGAKLLNESMTFRRKLETKPIYDSWLQEVSSKNLTIGGRVFAVTRGNGHGGTTSQICVNFDGQLVTLFKEVRNLIWLGFPIPHNIITCSKDGKRIYPFAISLTESIRYFNATTLVIKANPFILPLVETYRDKIQTLIRKGMTISWDMLSSAYDNRSYGAVVNESENPCVAFVKDLSLMAGTYHQKTVFVVSVNDEIGKLLQSLKSANYKEEVLKEIMDSLQKKVDSLSLESCSNLGSWVGNLNDRIGEILLSRLEDACKIWLKKFNLIVEEGSNDTNEESLEIRSFTHEIVISNQTLQVVPHVEKSREHWIKELHSWLGIACFLPKLNAERFDLGYEKSDLQNFKYLLSKLNKDSLVPIYESINVRISQMASYADDWLQHQALWDLNPGQVFEFLGKDLKKWQTLLAEIKKARGMTFDNSSDRKDFGHSSVLYGKVQGKVMAKYDAIQREIILHFGALMMDVMRSFHEELTNTRTQLESQSLDSESTSSAVSLVTFVQTVKKRILEWEEEIEVFVTGQKLLEKHRYSFPKDWMYVENIVGEWSAFQEIFQRKSLLIQDKLSIIQAKVITEDQALDAKAKQSLQEWEKSKPVQGSLKAVAVLSSLSAFETRFSRLQDDKIKVDKAKMALEMDVSPGNEFLKAVLEEIQDFKTVWNCLAKVWQMLDELREISWFSCSPRKIRQQLEQCSSELKEMPTRVRQYAAFEYVNDTVKNYIKYHSILSDLKSGSIKDRHWKHISKHLYNDAASLIPVEMNVGNVWDLDMKKNENFLKDVLSTAQGENALEEYLSQVKDHWQAFSLDLVNYQNKCRLVKGWDDVFTKCHEHIASLRSMKHSPYYKIFEEEALGWEEKLNRVFSLFDIWIDVQRQWVYLEGIFNESTDIRHLLPMETARFSGINSEYFAVLKKVYKSVVILDIIAIPNIQKSMERLQEMLLKIQKALGEYLEKERASFPRFYFVGDEDLLEIVGNSKDITKLQKHLRKMFAGIHGVILSDDSTAITGLFCSEGENIALTKPIVFKNYSKMNEWLTALELAMRLSLESLLGIAVREIDGVLGSSSFDESFLFSWIEKTPDQIILLSLQVAITSSVESKLQNLDELISAIDVILESLSSKVVVSNIDPLLRKKCEHLITELVYQRDVCRDLVRKAVSSCTDFEWLRRMRFYYKSDEREPLKRLSVKMANASFLYGFEYLGVPERLVKTPLTERCYLTLTQALESRLGGSPFGQAGTGKTESVKSLGLQLGRFVLVFCCDENFDFQAMGRIFIGLCKVGTFGCFDEFNRLEERILSAVSQQIQTIQLCLKNSLFDGSKNEIELVGKIVNVHPETGIFITMNPTYAGRSNLPENLKKLFRSIAMTKPDRQLIAQVMLFSQGFRHAESLARKMSPFFKLCEDQLSQQSHYDFGLRALKSCLISAGNLKRNQSQASTSYEDEQIILIQSIYETVLPKLTAEDIPLLRSLVSDFFEGVQYSGSSVGVLKETIEVLCREKGYIESEAWIQKVIQLYQIQCIHHGIMLVGSSASGKSSSWRILVEAIERIEKMESAVYVINPKAVSKESLYGHLDNTTREWNDGLFTHILRKVVDNVRGEKEKRHWIVFDGDIDPAWVENLNSVLDDNKLLTLPNGERLSLPDNVRVLFEVENVKYATMATVSRCGMVLFGSDVVDCTMILKHWFQKYQKTPFDEYEIDSNAAYSWQKECLSVLEPFFFPDQSTGSNIILKALDKSASLFHVMEFSRIRLIETFFAMMKKSIKNVINYNLQHSDFPLPKEIIQRYLFKRLVFSLIWSFSGDSKGSDQHTFSGFVKDLASTITVGTIDFSRIAAGQSLNDFDVSLQDGEWVLWKSKVPVVEVDTQKVAEVDVVIPTVDTVRNEELIYTLLAEHMPVILCGPPGSGKTMSLFSALRKLPDTEVLGVNFSSGTSFEFLISTFSQHCEYRKTPDGVILSPRSIGKWLVIFCDEINLPAYDNYGTQKVISFIRQLVEQNGFWKNKQWIQLERIQFVGACNPPTDPGRKPLSPRFLRHAPILYVDYPGPTALKQIYGTFIKSLLKITPNLRMYDEALTSAMIEFYLESQKKFTPDMEAHYVYSPRELTRWMRGIFESLRNIDTVSWENLIRIWAHEGLRLFYDRLTKEDERRWTDALIDSVAIKYFGKFDKKAALERPILFSNWLSKNYVSVDREVLREFVKARLRVFYEEELDVQLVLFDDVLDHVLRIDRVFRQWQGHLLLIGVSGAGKTTLSRFVAWMNGLSIFQVKAHKNYTIEDFDEDLKLVLKRCSYKGEKICFIIDEGNVLEPAFLERINTLLANAEIPGLFKEDEMAALMNSCKESAQKEGIMIDSLDETYRWFTLQIMKNLHVVFTMNPPKGGLQDRTATSPALFNRCVLDWFGDWSIKALYQVVSELTRGLDLDASAFVAPKTLPEIYISNEKKEITHRFAICNAFVHVHEKIKILNRILNKRFQRDNYITPRHYLDYINQFMALFTEKREQLEEQQRHINAGLERLHETVATVNELREKLAHKRLELEEKNDQANRKLSVMVAEQQEAEQQKQLCVDTEKILMQQKKVIDERKEMVMKDLARAEPAVQEAKMNVSNIKKQHLTELRAMGNPPDAVKLTMESVCIMLGHEVDSWKAVQSILRRDDFITSIVNYDTDKMMTKSMRTRISSEYMSQETFNFENVNRASKACGPLVSWIIAQVNYREILDKVGPLRNEVAQLESKADSTKTKVAEMRGKISDLEASIAKIKEEYAVLISQTQEIKQEMEKVKSKVDRSVTLLNSLSSERDRWEQTSKSFTAQLDSLAGDALISSAFLAYSGYFDQKHRAEMISSWTEFLADSNIHIRDSRFFSVLDYLASAEDRETWRSSGLASDVLSLENAAILKRFKRFPLIIDPTGQAVDFLSAMTSGSNKSGHLITTSFLDDSFVKHLESAIRFGNSILIQDVESFDPIINPILNRELKRVGGRVLITIGKQDVDVSPSFKLYLSTRDPVSRFSPDVCSRVTLINFTMTKSSLATQCLTRVLKFERPDIEEKRETIFKLQGEFQVRLRTLEKALLEALSESKGNILDDDNVISSMEKLKADVNDIEKRSIETENSMTQIEEVTKVYQYFAEASSSIFSSIEQLAFLNHYYQFSLDTFQKQIFDPVLSLNALKGISDPFKRLQILWQNLFIETYKRVSMSLMHKDHLVFSLNLCRIKLVADQSGSAVNHNEAFEYLLSPDLEAIAARKSDDLEKASSLVKGALFKSFETGFVREAIVKLKSDLHANQDLVYFEHLGLKSGDESDSIVHLRGLCLVKIACPEMLVLFLGKFIARNLGISPNDSSCSSLESAFGSGTDGLNGLYLIASPSGYDISNKVESLARSKDISLMTIAMGSLESIGLAENAISSAFQRNNGWILLKNIHLASEWLQSLEKKIFSVVKGGSKELKFRLFMTCDVGCLKVPTNLIRLSQVLVMEPPPGLKAALLSSFTSIPEKVLRKDPMERVKVFFVISWIHAILTERLRYPTLGWSKSYEINDCDFDSAVGIVDYWIDSVLSQHETRSNIPPEKIPWYAVKNLLLSYVYGSKMDNDFDAAVLSSFIDHLLGPKVFSGSFKLVPATSELTLGLAIPESNSVEKLKSWILESIPDLNPPSWLGLPNAAEKMVVLEEGKSIFAKIRRVFPDDDVKSDKISDYQKGQDYNDNNNGNNNDNNFKNDNNNDNNYNNDNVNVNDLTFSTSSQWASKIKATANHWLHQFSSLEKFEANKMNSKSSSVEMSSLERYFRRERLEANRLLAIVIGDLRLTMDVLEGREKSSNHSRDLVKCINLGIIPERWKSFYKCLSSFTIFQWMQDFKDRYAHLSSLGPLSEMSELAAKSVWLGGLFSPEGFLTATRQMYAKSLGVSIEMLALDAFIANSESDIAAKKINASHDYFSICDLELINAKVVPSLGILETCSDLSNAVPFMVLQWRQRDPLEIHASSKDLLSSTSEAKKIKIPLYLNSERENLLFSVDLQINNGDQSYLFYQRAVAFTATKG